MHKFADPPPHRPVLTVEAARVSLANGEAYKE